MLDPGLKLANAFGVFQSDNFRATKIGTSLLELLEPVKMRTAMNQIMERLLADTIPWRVLQKNNHKTRAFVGLKTI